MQKNIIITGASRGIGFELVKILSKEHQVLAISRNIKSLQNIPNCKALAIDLADFSAYSEITTYVKNNWKKVDIIIHNAGQLINKAFKDTSSQDFLNVYKVNVFAVAELTKSILPFLKKESHVVTISSIGGVQGSAKFPGLAAYSSSKGAVITLSELLAEEYKDKGISFNVLALGAVQTQMLAEAFPDYKAPVTATEMATYIADFSLTGNKYYNGKLLSVGKTTP